MDYNIKIKNINESCHLVKTPDDSKGFIAAKLTRNFPDSDFVFIAKSDKEIETINKQIRYFLPDAQILNFYAWDCLPYDRVSPKSIILSNRIKTLYKLANKKADQKFFIVTSINAISQKTVSPSNLRDIGIYLKVGSKARIDDIRKFLTNKGYKRQSCANDINEFAVRGGIIDIVIEEAADLVGYRIDFFGDVVESIKAFDPITQLTKEPVKAIEILPNSEVILDERSIENFRKNYREHFGAAVDDQLYLAISEKRTYPGMEHWLPFFYDNNLSSLFEYLEKPVCFIADELFGDLKEKNELVKEYFDSRIAEKKIRYSVIYNPISPELLYFSDQDFKAELEKHLNIKFNKFDVGSSNTRVIDLELKAVPDFSLAGRTNRKDPIELMKEYVFAQKQVNPKLKVIVSLLSESFKDRFAKIMLDYEINFSTTILPLDTGFYSSDFMVIGEQAIFGEKVVRRKNKKVASQRLLEEGLSINKGELVVHRDYGIGKFDGIQLINVGEIKIDMIKIIYGGNDTLFVPVDDINLITRYGADNPLIQLDKLGVAGWKNRREKVKKKIKVAAEALLKIAAARKLRKSPIFTPDQEFYEEFKNRFSFVETEDQLQAIEEIEEDLAKGSPMDRLICGDVGFGKTEVAMRAAAIVVSNILPPIPLKGEFTHSHVKNKLRDDLVANDNSYSQRYQVAIVAPTTLLVRQHYKNFFDRFKDLNINVKQLSRLITPAQAREIKKELESGKIDIIIGTHALLQKTIKFKNLGLVIVDEEQHFGVAQKERLKEFRNEIHILTLSATPIPRTLQMSLTGVKDLSLIATPPVDRLAVRNFVMPYDSVITKEAVMREYNRGGRVFFVVPRISDLEDIEPRLKILLPEVTIRHAHGRMNPTELDKIMNDFVDGKIDVLLSTTIIESGIDISQANTMIIYKADMFGLSQLYQLRGRVGRTKVRGYCYLMTNNRKTISADSKKKLEVMQNLDSLGVGFSIASHDMDIRGSGDILGGEQSGHIKETGAELYQQMLLETIEKEKNKHQKEQDLGFDMDFSSQVKLGISLLIPEIYIEDLALRMSFYKKIAAIKTEKDQDAILEEMTDRFGKVPEEINNLIEVAKLKFECQKMNIQKLEVSKSGVLIEFRNNKFKNPEKLMELIFGSHNQIKLQANQKVLFLTANLNDSDQKLKAAFEVVDKISNI